MTNIILALLSRHPVDRIQYIIKKMRIDLCLQSLEFNIFVNCFHLHNLFYQLLYFLYRLAGFIGFRINTSSWQENYVFNINDGSFYPSDPATPYISGPNTAKIIYQLCTCPLAEIKAIPLNRQSRNILLDVILLFYSIHLNINFNIKSIQVIREVFA